MRAEAGDFVVRTGRLIALATRLPQLGADDRFAAVDSLSEEDRVAWEIMHRRPGRRLSVRFGHETLSTQLPVLNLYTAEPVVRSISEEYRLSLQRVTNSFRSAISRATATALTCHLP